MTFENIVALLAYLQYKRGKKYITHIEPTSTSGATAYYKIKRNISKCTTDMIDASFDKVY